LAARWLPESEPPTDQLDLRRASRLSVGEACRTAGLGRCAFGSLEPQGFQGVNQFENFRPGLGLGGPCLLRKDTIDVLYPSHGVLQALVSGDIDFLIRMPASHSFAAIDSLRASGADDGLFLIDPPEGSPADWTPIEVRVVRLQNSNGEQSFFFTSLRRSEFSRSKLREGLGDGGGLLMRNFGEFLLHGLPGGDVCWAWAPTLLL